MNRNDSSFSEDRLSIDADEDWIALLNFLGDVAADLLEVEDLDEISEILDQTVDQIISVQYPVLYLYDEEHERLEQIWSKGFTEAETRAAEKTALQRHPGWVLRNAEGFYIPDVQNDPQNRTQDSPRARDVRSRLYHPVVTQGECVGAFGFAASERDAFDQEHIAALGFYSHLIGATYGRLRRERQLEFSRRRFERLTNIFYRLGPDPATNIEIVVQEARTLLEADFSVYRRYDADDGSLAVVTSDDLPEAFPDSEPAAGSVCFERTMQSTGEATALESLESAGDGRFPRDRGSYLGAAVAAGGEPIGALCIGTDDPNEFSDADFQIVSTLGKAISLEEERRDANRRVSRLNETLGAIREVSKLIVRERDRPRILHSTCELLVETEAYEYAFVLGRTESEGVEVEALAPSSNSTSAIHEFLGNASLDKELADALAGKTTYFTREIDETVGGTLAPDERRVDRVVGISLSYAGIVYGVLVLGAAFREANPRERTLLEGVASDLAFVSHMLSLEEGDHQLAEQALRDWLTELPNRALFRNRLQQAIARAERHGASFALLLLDLDNLKDVNDSLGHAAGDRLLVRVSERLSEIFRQYDTVARIGGDEFTVIVEGIDSPNTVDRLLERVEQQFDVPFEIYGNTFHTSASIGVVRYDELAAKYEGDQLDENELMRVVDRGMYKAKELPGTRWSRPEAGDLESSERIQRANRLRRAIGEGRVIPHYQPVVTLEDGAIVGVEALARWRREAGGVRRASEFIETAERMGRLWDVTKEVIRNAFVDLERWRRETDRDLALYLNVSPTSFDRDELLALFAEYDVTPPEVVFEITEQDLLRNPDRIQSLLDRGFGVAIDDFGTGYSSFEYLKRFDVDCLKVDMTFVQGAPSDPTDRAILETICNLGEKLGLRVIGEGVETEAHREHLVEFDSDCAQGRLFGSPVPGAEIERRLFGQALSTAQPDEPSGD